MHCRKVRVLGDDFVGLLGFASDKYVVYGLRFPETGVLEVPDLRCNVYGTRLVGLFCAGNSNGVVFPYFVSEEEVSGIIEFLKGLGVSYGFVSDKNTALGNLVTANDKAAVVSPYFEDVKIFEDVLDVEVVQRPVGGHMEVGSCLVATNRGFLAHPDASGEIDELSSIFGVKGNVGSVNYGIKYVKSGIIANSNGFITGEATTGFETGRIEEALGFLD